jgi:hypothetical protein
MTWAMWPAQLKEKAMNRFIENAKKYGKRAALGVAVGMYSAASFATTDPSAAVIAEIDQNKGYALAVAGAMTLAILGLKAVKLLRRA